MDETKLDRNKKRGSRGKRVRIIQEWLSLHGQQVKIDGRFGPATEEAVRHFRRRKGRKPTGVVDKRTYAELVAPLIRAKRAIKPGKRSLGQLAVAYARQHLRERPREIGGQNRGPWVRLYMKGREGPAQLWCAGFVSYVLRQASKSAGLPVPIRPSASCDVLASRARNKGLLIDGSRVESGSEIGPGFIFLNRRTANDWNHTGFVTSGGDEVLRTIEGNTNDDGSREGYEVCARFRNCENKDFIRI